MTTPTIPTQSAEQQDDSNRPDEDAVAGSVNLHRAFSRLNEAIAALFDGLGVKRSATIPHIEGQPMADHLADVSQVLQQTGGMTSNLVTSTHSKHGPNGGVTVAHPAQKLRETIIPNDDPKAIKAIDACKSFVSKVESLIGETPEVKLAKSQLARVGKHHGSGMSAADLGVALLNIPTQVIQAVARAHSGTKDGGHGPQLRAPKS